MGPIGKLPQELRQFVLQRCANSTWDIISFMTYCFVLQGQQFRDTFFLRKIERKQCMENTQRTKQMQLTKQMQEAN